MPQLDVTHERFALREPFVISRGSKLSAEVVTVNLREQGRVGSGECVPYGRYGETVATVIEAAEGTREALEAGCSREHLRAILPAGAARNAIDCALWDLESKHHERPAWTLANPLAPSPQTTMYTLSIRSPAAMADKARLFATWPQLKLKLAGDGNDLDRIRAVHDAAPGAKLIVDANESLSAATFSDFATAAARLGVVLIEQPLPANDDGVLAQIERPIAVCADESFHGSMDLNDLVDRYDVVNIKLDKAGGLTEALEQRRRARELGLGVMVGTMCCTSLSLAAASILAQDADWVDLDCGLFLKQDRADAVAYDRWKLDGQACTWGNPTGIASD